MDEDLPTEYDVIIIGTGMAESIVAAAASRIGKKVLHLDRNDYYGGMWASFNFETLQKWLDECRNPNNKQIKSSQDNAVKLNSEESLIVSGNQFSTVFNIEEKWFVPESFTQKSEAEPTSDGTGPEKASEKKVWDQAAIKNCARKFNLDLAPKLLFSRGSLVELLISSNIARYAEFRSVNRILTWINSKLESVPCSRADVFANKDVSAVEKRVLMKLLSLCVDYKPEKDEFKDFEDKTFVDYLKSKEITDVLLHYVLYAIAMSNEKTPCMVGVERAQRFLSGLGRYGNTPFLWPLYGSGELPQCFCRLCAVFGGVYHLKRAADSIVVEGANENSLYKGIISDGQKLTSEFLVLGVPDAPKDFLQKAPAGGLSRGIFVTNKSILPADKESLTLLQFPQGESKEPITVIEVGPATHACPPGLHVVHMTCKQQASAVEDLKFAVKSLLCDDVVNEMVVDNAETKKDENKESDDHDKVNSKPQILWALYFNCPETSESDLLINVPKNVFLTSGPDLDIDFEFAVKQAKDIFSKMYPDAEFLPRAPDPEEIVLESEDETGPKFETESSFSEDKAEEKVKN